MPFTAERCRLLAKEIEEFENYLNAKPGRTTAPVIYNGIIEALEEEADELE